MSTHFEVYDHMTTPLQEGKLGDFEAHSPLAACVLPLLHALGWNRDLREIAEALPHFGGTMDLVDFRNVLARLGYRTIKINIHRGEFDVRILPCLHLEDDGSAAVLLERSREMFKIYDGNDRKERIVKEEDLTGSVYAIMADTYSEEETVANQENWVGEMFGRFRGSIVRLAGMTFILNMIALSVPLFVMAVYDRVIPTKSGTVMLALGIGISLAFLIELGVRIVRAKTVAFIGARIESIVANAVFHKIMSLPSSQTESASLGSQVSRIREFDNIRDIFTGPLATILLEVPFILIFLGVIASIGGILVFVPLVMLALFAIASLAIRPRLKRAITMSGKARAARQSFLVEMVTKFETISEVGGAHTWANRYRDISAEASYWQFRTGQINFLYQAFSQTIMMSSGIATIALGVYRVGDGLMSIGALIASMALVWRVLSPLQQVFLTLTRMESIRSNLSQVNQLMKLSEEERVGKKSRRNRYRRKFKGEVSLTRVSFRYQPTAEPALLGVNITIPAGQSVAITGNNGAGKSTLLRMILGLHQPQAGQISIDGGDIRQINPTDLRHSISYVPQVTRLFHGTISQNLRLANPVADMAALEQACKTASLYDDVMALEDGFETRIGDKNISAFSRGFIQRLALARAYLKDVPIILMDEAAQSLDDEGEKALVDFIKSLDHKKTLIMITHRPSHMRLCDRVLVLRGGLLIMDGKPDPVLAKLAEMRGK